jgi:hypothetical protein
MRITYFCSISAALAGITGMALGLYMGMAEDHSLAPAHAHLNLLGWVTMMLYGLYHRGAPQDARALRWVQVGLGAAGFPAFSGGLAVYLATGDEAMFPVAIAGIVFCILSMVLFAAILMRDAWRTRPAHAQWQMHTAMSG